MRAWAVCWALAVGVAAAGGASAAASASPPLVSDYFAGDQEANDIALGLTSVQFFETRSMDAFDVRWRIQNALRMLGAEQWGLPYGETIDAARMLAIDTELAAKEVVIHAQASRIAGWQDIWAVDFADNIPQEFGVHLVATIFDLFNASGTPYQRHTVGCVEANFVPQMCGALVDFGTITGESCENRNVPLLDPITIQMPELFGFANVRREILAEEYPTSHLVRSTFGYVATMVHEFVHDADLRSRFNSDTQRDWDRAEECGTFYLARDLVDPTPFRYEGVSGEQDIAEFVSYYASGLSNAASDYRPWEDFAESITAFLLLPEYFRDRMEHNPRLQEKYEYIRDRLFDGVEFDNPCLAEHSGPFVVPGSTGGFQIDNERACFDVDAIVATSGSPRLQPGDIVVTDIDGDRVIAVDPGSGNQEVISEQGTLATPTDVAVESSSSLLVVDRASVAVLRIDAETGDQAVVSSGGRFAGPRTLALEPDGDILVGDPTTGEIVRIDPVGGGQSLVTDIGGLGEGFVPWSMALAAPADLYVLARFADTVVHVDPATGAAVPLSSGGMLVDPDGLAITSKTPVVFDFDDWPSWESILDLDDEPYLTSYDCDGKGFCSTNDIEDLVGFGNPQSVATTRSGLTATFTRPSGPLVLLTYFLSSDGHLDADFVNEIPDDGPFRAEFSEPVRFASVEIHVEWVETPGPQARFQLEAFDGIGTPVASVSELAEGATLKTLSLDHPDGFSAIQFRAFDPDFVPTSGYPESAFVGADDIVVGPIPWIVVADAGAAAVVRIDPRNGTQELLAQGDRLSTPRGIAASDQREVFVVDGDEVIRIDFATGGQTSVAHGGSLESPRGITVVPEPSRRVLLAAGALLLLALGRRRAAGPRRSSRVASGPRGSRASPCRRGRSRPALGPRGGRSG